MKLISKILFFLVVLIVLAVVFKNTLIKAAVTFGVSKATGLGLNIQNLDVNFSDTFIDIRDLSLDNPEGFPDETMIQIPQAYVNYELSPLFKGNVHLTSLKLHLKEFLIIRNADGQLNLNVVREKLEKEKVEETKEEQKAPSEAQEKGELHIDELQLKIERVLYKDYTVGTDPLVQTFDINIDETYKDITEFESIIGIIVSKALRNSTLARLTNLNPEEFLQSNVFNTLTMTNQAMTKIGDTAMSKVEGTAESVVGTANAMVGSLKDTVKLPFGKKEEAQPAQ